MTTTTVQHTPGPWHVYYSLTQSIDPFIADARGRTLAKMFTVSGDGPTDNAPLFAAAPALLDALVDMVTGMDMHGIRLLGIDAARAAIAQARGESA